MPFFDPDNSVVYLGAKGEGAIKLYELTDNDSLVYLSDFKSAQPAAGMVCFVGLIAVLSGVCFQLTPSTGPSS